MALRTLVIFLCVLIGFASGARAETLEAMEAITARFATLDQFLADEGAVREYFMAMQARYGAARFSEESFKTVLGQVREMNAKIKGFGARAWETNQGNVNLGQTFTIKSDLKQSGKQTNHTVWDPGFAGWTTQLTELSAPISSDAAAMAIFESKAAELAQITDGKQKGAFFQKMAGDPQMQSAIAYAIKKHISHGTTAARLASGDADLILLTVNQLKQNPGEALAGLGPAAQQFKSAVKTSLQPLEKLAADDKAFPPKTEKTSDGKSVPIGATDAGVVEAIPIPRRIHAFFKHIVLNECVGGGCDHLESTTPERWATIVLEGSQMHELQRKENKKYLGYTQLTPLQQREFSDRILVNADFGATILKRDALVEDPASPTGYRRTTFIDQWLTQARAHTPKEWTAFVVPEYQRGDNSGVLSRVRELPTYALGPALDQGEYIRHRDPIAAEIIAHSPTHGYAGEHGGNMILDSLMAKEERLIQLLPSTYSEYDLHSLKKLEEMLKTLKLSQRLRLIEALTENFFGMEEVPLLTKILTTDPAPEVRAAAAWALYQRSGDPTTGDYGSLVFTEARHGTTKTSLKMSIAMDADGGLTGKGTYNTKESLMQAIKDPDATVRTLAQAGLFRQGVTDPALLPDFYKALGNNDASLMPHLLVAMYKVHGMQPRFAEYHSLRSEMLYLANATGVKNPALIDAAIRVLNTDWDARHPDQDLRLGAIELLGTLNGENYEAKLALAKEFNFFMKHINSLGFMQIPETQYESFLKDDPEFRRSDARMKVMMSDPALYRYLELVVALFNNHLYPPDLNGALLRLVTLRAALGEDKVARLIEQAAHERPEVMFLLERYRGGIAMRLPTGELVPDTKTTEFVNTLFERLHQIPACRDNLTWMHRTFGSRRPKDTKD